MMMHVDISLALDQGTHKNEIPPHFLVFWDGFAFLIFQFLMSHYN